jgi:hypothetical protein
MSDEEIDTNIDNYSVDDIMEMLNLPNNPTEYQVKNSTNRIIAKLKSENNTELVDFFQQALVKILNSFSEGDATEGDATEGDAAEGDAAEGDTTEGDANEGDATNEQFDETKQLGNWWKNEYPSQSNKSQTDKYTIRKNTTQIFADKNNHFQMNREKIGINQQYQLPVVQDELNPNLKNTITRLVSIDSQYRQNILPYSNGDSNSPAYNTDFTVNLSDQLNRVINMKLYSVQIPTTWYTFDESLGNLCFDYISGLTTKTISISSGNYTIDSLKTAIESSITSNGIPYLSIDIVNPEKGGLFQFTNTGPTSITLVFYSENGFQECSGGCGPGSKINQNLGWNLGFRITPDIVNGIISLPISAGGSITAAVPPDVYGPKYFMLIIDDYNQNHLNNGLVNINDTVSKLSIPTYYNPDANLDNVACSVGIPFLKGSSPRTLTQAQIYSANEIIANRKKNSNRTTGPTNSDVMALIPLKTITDLRPQPYVEFGVNLQSNERTYFGPVDIDRLRIKLLDDKGNLVNLHDHDWSFTLTIEQLYQY